ncbi:hypothetical protein [Winogradskyella sp. SYSU M77433]|uniref:hypothetical protein n=1 Tax=Winogradskyella sp. SYSU M77433 TaxID=3042722 RepID=UPI0024811AF5|nr:hypothetical protein [Winogradskyella sp. SYSU M77433]MDH7913485.1 hypothetical protein [Winogradskyella sp. SYSU M77433]
MKARKKIYKNRFLFRSISLLLILIGLVMAYYFHNTEPWETIGGFLCGVGLGLLIIFVAIKESKTDKP